MNSLTIVGNLAEDPELRFTPNGVAVANVRVAVNRRRRNQQSGEWEDQLDGFFTVNVWRDMAENVAASLQKGSRVMVSGRIRTRSYEDRDGNTRWVTEIEAEEVAASLRWAKADVTRTSGGNGGRSQSSSSGGGNASSGSSTGDTPQQPDPFAFSGGGDGNDSPF